MTGYIKFKCNWIKAEPLPAEQVSEINRWRNKLYDLELIGVYDNGIGFGNISARLKGNEFIITGSATGNRKRLDGRHYTKVANFDIDKNTVTCEGPIKASSESMTHAAVYAQDKSVNAVVHVHSLKMWKKLLNKVPTTSADAKYGTPEIANEIIRILKGKNAGRIIALAGHKAGILTFGRSLEEAAAALKV